MYTNVYIAATDAFRDRDNFLQALELVSEERKAKVLRFKSESASAASLGAEILLRRGLRDCGIIAESFDYGYEEYGKPYLKGISGFHFNLSHSGDYVMAAVSDREIGCDIEKITLCNLKVARRFFAPEEYEMIISEKGEQERGELFCRFWTLKESFLKATGRGLSLPMNEFRFVTDSGGEIQIIQKFDQRDYFFTEISSQPGYRAAICQTGARCGPEIIRTDLMSEMHFLAGNQS